MNARLSVMSALAALALAIAPSAVLAEGSGDCEVPIELGQKPDMGNYADYSDFLVAIMGYKQKQRDQKEQRKSCPELFITPPIVWDQDESIDDAVQQASQREPFDYQRNPSWYNRSTSESITLQDVSSQVLEGELINTQLATLDQNSTDSDQLSLLLSALNGSTEDGSTGQNVDILFPEWLSASRENELVRIDLLLDNPGLLLQVTTSSDGSLTSAVDPIGDILRAYSLNEFESCLSSCGEFELTIGWQ